MTHFSSRLQNGENQINFFFYYFLSVYRGKLGKAYKDGNLPHPARRASYLKETGAFLGHLLCNQFIRLIRLSVDAENGCIRFRIRFIVLNGTIIHFWITFLN